MLRKNRVAFITSCLSLMMLQIAVAQPTTSAVGDSAAMSKWEREALYEPCMNGEVSANGLYPSQIAEDKSFATLGRLAQLQSGAAASASTAAAR